MGDIVRSLLLSRVWLTEKKAIGRERWGFRIGGIAMGGWLGGDSMASIILAQAIVIRHGLTEGHCRREVNENGWGKMVILGAMKT
jgi:hypothetical protein